VPDVGAIEAEVHGDFGDAENDDDEEDHCPPKLQRLKSVTEEHCKQPMYLLTDSCLASLLADIPVSCRCGAKPKPKRKGVGSAVTVNWVRYVTKCKCYACSLM